jgi:hypothetical protein
VNTVEFSKAELKPTVHGLFLLIALYFKLLAGYLLGTAEFGIFGLFVYLSMVCLMILLVAQAT